MLSRAQRPARLDQLAAGRHHHHARTGRRRHPAEADRREQAELARPDHLAGAHQQRRPRRSPPPHAGCADPPRGPGVRRPRDPVLLGPLERHDRGGTPRDRSTGHDAHARCPGSARRWWPARPRSRRRPAGARGRSGGRVGHVAEGRRRTRPSPSCRRPAATPSARTSSATGSPRASISECSKGSIGRMRARIRWRYSSTEIGRWSSAPRACLARPPGGGAGSLAEDGALVDPTVVALEDRLALDLHAAAEGPVALDDERLGLLQRRHPGREALVELLDHLVVVVEVDERAGATPPGRARSRWPRS